MQPYLRSSKVHQQEAKEIFMFRTRSAELKVNFRGKYENDTCPFNDGEKDTQEHLLICLSINESSTDISYSDLFSDNVEKNVTVVKQLSTAYKRRLKLLDRTNV